MSRVRRNAFDERMAMSISVGCIFLKPITKLDIGVSTSTVISHPQLRICSEMAQCPGQFSLQVGDHADLPGICLTRNLSNVKELG